MKKFILYIIILFFVIGCGGGGSGGDTTTSKPELNSGTVMKLNKEYQVYDGSYIVRENNDTKLRLETDYQTGETIAILKRGKATLYDE